MKAVLKIVLLTIGFIEMGLSQEVIKLKSTAFAIIPQVGNLTSSAPTAMSTYRFGVKLEALKGIPLSARAVFYIGPSLQTASISNRTNKFQWPADSKDGEWVPGLSFEDFRTSFVALGGSASLIYNLSAVKHTWNITAGTSLRYLVHHDDKLILNESGNIREVGPGELGLKVNPLQVLLDLGLNYSFPVNSHYLSIGPQIEYGVSSLIGESATNLWDAAHLSFFGLKVFYH